MGQSALRIPDAIGGISASAAANRWSMSIQRTSATDAVVYVERVGGPGPNPARSMNSALRYTGLRVGTDWRSKDLVLVIPILGRPRGMRVPLPVGTRRAVRIAEPAPGAWPVIPILNQPPVAAPAPGPAPEPVAEPAPGPEPAPEPLPAPAPDDSPAPVYRYRPSTLLSGTVQVIRAMLAAGDHNNLPNLLLRGPSGTGKSAGAQWMAGELALPYTKVDASAIVEPTDWYGTREIVTEDGAPRTVVVPSAFVAAIQQRGLLFIDEVNRTAASRNLNPLLGLLDTTHSVTDPLTGQPLRRHPECVIVMAANIGFGYIATEALDPALTSRAIHVPFGYPAPQDERDIIRSVSGCSARVADYLARLAATIRERAQSPESGVPPVSTRDLAKAATLVRHGMPMAAALDLAIVQAHDTDSPDAAGSRLALVIAAYEDYQS